MYWACVWLRLLLRARIGRGTDDGTGGAAQYQACSGVARAADDRTDDGAADGTGHGAAARRAPPAAPSTRSYALASDAARVNSRLLHSPEMALVPVSLGLLRALALIGIHENSLRRRRGRPVGARRCFDAGGKTRRGREGQHDASNARWQNFTKLDRSPS